MTQEHEIQIILKSFVKVFVNVKNYNYRQVGELVVPADVSVVGSEGHQEVDEGENDQGARHRRQDEHHLGHNLQFN